MPCPACQHDNPTGAKFCSECGSPPAGRLRALRRQPPRRGEVLLGVRRPGRERSGDAAQHVGVALAALGRPLPDLEAQFAVMRQAMPAVLQDRLLAEADGENRLLTILFSDLTGSVKATAQLAPEDAAALVNDVLKLMIDAVLEHDGRISRLLGDGMLAFFGTPVARESDPERAILAAMRIREQVRKLGLDVTAGVNTGEVYLGTVGTEGHHEITAMGAAINLAARLRESAQPGEIVVGEATYHHTRRMFELTPRLVDAKGFADPVQAYLVERRMERPEKVRGVEGLHADLIGRDEELQKLRLALDEVRLGRGQLVSIVGEAGVGKSRLIADLGQIALADPERAPRWLEGRCLDIGMAVSYWPFLDLFRSCFGWTVQDDEAARGRRLVATLRGLVEEGALGRGALPGADPAARRPALGRPRQRVVGRQPRQRRAGSAADDAGDPRRRAGAGAGPGARLDRRRSALGGPVVARPGLAADGVADAGADPAGLRLPAGLGASELAPEHRRHPQVRRPLHRDQAARADAPPEPPVDRLAAADRGVAGPRRRPDPRKGTGQPVLRGGGRPRPDRRRRGVPRRRAAAGAPAPSLAAWPSRRASRASS